MENGREIGALTARMDSVEKRLGTLEDNTSEILAILAREEGARIEREKADVNKRDVVELSWTKVMALAAVMGVIIAAEPLFYHMVVLH